MRSVSIRAALALALFMGACGPVASRAERDAGPEHSLRALPAPRWVGQLRDSHEAWLPVVGLALTLVLGGLRLFGSGSGEALQVVARQRCPQGRRRRRR